MERQYLDLRPVTGGMYSGQIFLDHRPGDGILNLIPFLGRHTSYYRQSDGSVYVWQKHVASNQYGNYYVRVSLKITRTATVLSVTGKSAKTVEHYIDKLIRKCGIAVRDV